MNAPLNRPVVLRTRLPDRHATHAVTNQPSPATDYNAFENDAVLRAVIAREAPWARARCAALGRLVGDADVQDHVREADRHPPRLRTHDRHGHRIDWVESHPSWHALMRLGWHHQVHALAWNGHGPRPQVARAVLALLWNQVDSATGAAIGQTHAAFAGLEHEPALAIWADRARRSRYTVDRAEVGERSAVLVGQAIAEKQAGSDLDRLATTARYSHAADYHGGRADWHELTGHKWFCPLPQADGFLTLARVDGELTAFLVPRTLPDGGFNRFFIQRLKDRLGQRAAALAEVEFSGTLGIRIGATGAGLAVLAPPSQLLRLDAAVAAAAMMRQALTLALRHARTRAAFGTRLVDRPMMTNVLADLAVEAEAASLLAIRAARALDLASVSEHEHLLGPVAIAAAAVVNGLAVTPFVAEALQCHGGNGCVEEFAIARLLRDAPAAGLAAGSINIIARELRGLLTGQPAMIEALFDEVTPLLGQDPRFDGVVHLADDLIRQARQDEFYIRPMAVAIGRMLQAAELLRHSPADVVAVFLATRAPTGTSRVGGAFGLLAGPPGAAITAARAAAVVSRAVVA